jgi:hypothetical protein
MILQLRIDCCNKRPQTHKENVEAKNHTLKVNVMEIGGWLLGIYE